VADGTGLGLGFGLGAITVPSLIYGVGVAYMAAQLRQHLGRWLPWLERTSAGLMLLTGVKLLGGWGWSLA
jgi:threonine/homoserine/homoserine lactone efflux protein